MKTLARLYGVLIGAVRIFLIVSFAILVASVFLQVVARYIFHSPPFWTEELSRFTLVWLTFIGAVLAHHHREHIRADMVLILFPRTVRTAVEILISIIVLAMLIVVAIAGYEIAMLGTQRAPALGISMRYIYMSLPIGAVLMILVTLVHVSQQVSDLVSGEKADAS